MAGDGRNHFIDPKSGFDYSWDTNHTTEESPGKSRTINHAGSTSRTTNTGLVKQQGDDGPLLIKLKGTMFKLTQVEYTIGFWQLCNSQTIYYKDFSGSEYEVIITSFVPVKKGVAKNPRDKVNAPLWIWEYSIDMEVVKVLSGEWVTVTP